ncbi:hypothetical protein SKAU_G00170890 [Synaphobranchus kaupii]|uniref:Uncharacterized protein n=1 Tax=Synaphobranchus kaupii TaxID=118154 RepID=A0A9Q1FKU6_SYNKA|nr:hypothetical protein SKAU_G00170890 [Synaphobranchus kaupii]
MRWTAELCTEAESKRLNATLLCCKAFSFITTIRVMAPRIQARNPQMQRPVLYSTIQALLEFHAGMVMFNIESFHGRLKQIIYR